jgi:hypothetical protein
LLVRRTGLAARVPEDVDARDVVEVVGKMALATLLH